MNDTTWILKGGKVLGPAPFFIAGIVNVTPDSFFDGGEHTATSAGVAHGQRLARLGADILDVGGESTRPYADAVSEAEELDRVVPVIKGLSAWKAEQDAEAAASLVISVDTYKASVAAQALEAGADIVNDVSACAYDPGLLDILAQFKPGYVLMHSLGKPEDMQDAPQYGNVVDDILAFFETKLEMLDKAGLPLDRVVLDPGIGFGKLLEHNVEILQNIEKFKSLNLPIYMGLSNKSVWQGMLGLEVNERGNATQAGTCITAMKGAAIHRVHDVQHARQTLTIVQEIA